MDTIPIHHLPSMVCMPLKIPLPVVTMTHPPRLIDRPHLTIRCHPVSRWAQVLEKAPAILQGSL